ncbi:16S rRNA (uracil(1498)-N(3))-methyltransferase [Cryomorphaceae bacterium]|nr:16S rRNA (uracil(1498)-N(3))-methyltransferase [Cryomorphaceae bacterium]
MPEFYAPDFDVSRPELPPDESKHAVRVLRLSEGDQVEVVNGRGQRFQCIISTADPKGTTLEVQDTFEEAPRAITFHLAIAPTKNRDRIEWLVEKAVELGVERITLLEGDHSERAKVNFDRLERIMVSAMKQSKRSWLPELKGLIKTSSFWPNVQEEEKYIAHCEKRDKVSIQSITGNSCVIAIGPEGDFSSSEIELAQSHGWMGLDLGDMRLRTETAGLLSCSVLALKSMELR